MLRQQLEKQQMDRNYVQLERDTIETFSHITKKEMRDLECLIGKCERQMGEMDQNHRTEIRVYMQKVRHLEFEHKNNLKSLANEGEKFEREENRRHDHRESMLKEDKASFKTQLLEQELSNAEQIRTA